MNRRRAPRGQAVLETTLAVMVFTTLLLGGLFLSETLDVGFKVHEAAAFAALNASLDPVQNLSNTGTASVNHGNVISRLETEANARFHDFDGVHTGGARPFNLVFAAADALSVQCGRDSTADLRAYDDIGLNGAATNPVAVETTFWHAAGMLGALPDSAQYQALVTLLGRQYTNQGGLKCHAEAHVMKTRLPNNYLTGGLGGFFSEPIVALAAPFLTICSPGRAVSGQCVSNFATLAGDLAMDDVRAPPSATGSLNADCTLRGCQNRGYRDMVEALYNANGGQLGTRWATEMVKAVNLGSPALGTDVTRPGKLHYLEDDFFMSFAGEESGYLDGFYNHRYNTSGVSAASTRRDANATTPASWNGAWAGIPQSGLSNWVVP